MSRCGIVIVFALAACGDNHAAKDAATGEPTMSPATPLLACETTTGTELHLRRIAYGCDEVGSPPAPGCLGGITMLVTSPPDDPRLFVLQQYGAIRIITDDGVIGPPFLDLSPDADGNVLAGGELGLLGLAFHPDYATNGKFYVDFTAYNPDPSDAHNPVVDIVMEFTRSATDPDLADPTSGRVILSIPDFAGNHNAGMIEFGGDGYLYVATGDGGGAGDPDRNGQNTHALLAKILRIDVDHPAAGQPYGIPSDNPFANGVDGAPEVFIYGVRNPWRWSFDRANGDMWIGDVGQNQIEELDVLVAGQQAGKNLGWSAYEGTRCCASAESDNCNQSPPQQACDPTGKFMPQWQIEHKDNWVAIIGGQVYRGACYPDLVGTYVFTDDQDAHLTTATLELDGSVIVTPQPRRFPAPPASIHAAGRGELYETDVKGAVWQIEAK
jgi:glucose/arabinose dehydrogenase